MMLLARSMASGAREFASCSNAVVEPRRARIEIHELARWSVCRCQVGQIRWRRLWLMSTYICVWPRPCLPLSCMTWLLFALHPLVVPRLKRYQSDIWRAFEI